VTYNVIPNGENGALRFHDFFLFPSSSFERYCRETRFVFDTHTYIYIHICFWVGCNFRDRFHITDFALRHTYPQTNTFPTHPHLYSLYHINTQTHTTHPHPHVLCYHHYKFTTDQHATRNIFYSLFCLLCISLTARHPQK